jgi:hypothetical protein
MGKKKVIPDGRQKGFIRKVVGVEKNLRGDLTPCRFYLGKDERIAEEKLKRIELEWASLKAAGHQWWTDEAIQKLVVEGVINQRKVHGNHAARLVGEPLNSAELAPYIDKHSGLITPEAAPKALDHGCRKVFGRLDVRSRFFDDLYTQALKDPLSTFERCSRMFGWTSKETQAFLFNVSGSMSVNPIAYDATATASPDKEQELKDAGILKGDDGDTV